MALVNEYTEQIKDIEEILSKSEETLETVTKNIDSKGKDKNEKLKTYVQDNFSDLSSNLKEDYSENVEMLINELTGKDETAADLEKLNKSIKNIDEEEVKARKEAVKLAKESLKTQEDKLKEIIPDEDDITEFQEKIEELKAEKEKLFDEINDLKKSLIGSDEQSTPEIEALEVEVEEIDDKISEMISFFSIYEKLQKNIKEQKETFKKEFLKVDIDFEEALEEKNKYYNNRNRNNYKNNKDEQDGKDEQENDDLDKEEKDDEDKEPRKNYNRTYNNDKYKNENRRNGEKQGDGEYKPKENQNNFTPKTAQTASTNPQQQAFTGGGQTIYTESVNNEQLPVKSKEGMHQDALNELHAFIATGKIDFVNLKNALDVLEPIGLNPFTQIKLKSAIKNNQNNIKENAEFLDKDSFSRLVGVKGDELDFLFGEKPEDILRFTKKIKPGEIKLIESTMNNFYSKVASGEINDLNQISEFENKYAKYIKAGLVNTQAKELGRIFFQGLEKKSLGQNNLSNIMKQGDQVVSEFKMNAMAPKTNSFNDELKENTVDVKNLNPFENLKEQALKSLKLDSNTRAKEVARKANESYKSK